MAKRTVLDIMKNQQRSLFQQGKFKSAAGLTLTWKIECDALTPDDWDTLAFMLVERAQPFGSVAGVPRGGTALANALRPYATEGPRLLVDDVWTTGTTLAKYQLPDDQIWVVFARGPLKNGAKALFTLSP